MNKFNGIVVVPIAISMRNLTKLFVFAGCSKSCSNIEPLASLFRPFGKNFDKETSILAQVSRFGVEYRLPSKSV